MSDPAGRSPHLLCHSAGAGDAFETNNHDVEVERAIKLCVVVGDIQMGCIYLSPGLFHKALIGELECPAEGLARVVAEGFLPYKIHMEVVGRINGGVHTTVSVKHGKIGLFVLILPDDTSHMTILHEQVIYAEKPMCLYP